MKSKYIKIFMIFAVMFAMLSALLVTPKATFAKGSEAEIEYDLNAIKASIPSTAILSFPVPYQSVYGNEINWTVQEGQSVITYDKDAYWMVVDRSKVQGKSQTITITVNVEGTTNTFEVAVPAGETAVPSYTYTLNYGYEGKESETKNYKLGQASITLEQPTRDNYRFDGWFDANGKKYEKILVGSMSNISLTAKWTELAVESITLDTTKVQTSYKGGDDLVTTGLVVKALWNNGEITDVTSGFECNPVVVNYNTTEKVEVTVTYQGKSATYTVDVSQNENSITGLSIEGWTYGDEANAPTAKALYGQMKFLYSDSENGVYTETVPTNAGTYFVKAVVEAAEDANYKGVESAPVEFKISKKALTLSTNAQTVSIKDIANLKWEFTSNDFEGEDKLTEEVLANLVVKYYQNGVEATPMAGQTYDVRFSGLTMPNYNITIKDSKLTVNTEELYFEYENFEGEVYDAENHMFTVKAYAEAGEVDIEITDATIVITLNDQKFTGAVNAGTYNVTISIDSPTYGFHTETKSFEIAKASQNLTVSIDSWTYNEPNEPTCTGANGEVTYKYYVKETNEELTEKPSNVGSYYVVATAAETTNYNAAEAIAEFKIAKADQSLTVTMNGWTYGDTKEPTYTGAIGEVTIKYFEKNTDKELTEKPSNVGSYYVKAIAAKTQNYNAAEATADFTISKSQEEITNLVFAGWTYGDKAEHEPTADSKFGTVVYTYYVKETNVKLDSKPTDAGSYYVKATVEGTENYDGDEEQLDFTIAKLNLENNENAVVTVLGSDWNTSVQSTLTPGVIVTYNGQEITSHNPPTYAYADETKIGTATLSVELTGNYEGTLSATFEVTEFGQAGIDAEELPESLTETYLTSNSLPIELGKSKVHWSSSHTSVVVNNEDGQVSINKVGLTVDTEIILTATVNCGTTSSYLVTYKVTIEKAPESEDINDENVTIYDAPYGYEVVANETTDEEDKENYKMAVEINNGYEYVTSYNISLKNHLGESAQPGKFVTVRINGEFDTANNYVIYYIDENDQTTLIQPIEITETYIKFETDHFSVYAIAVEKEESDQPEESEPVENVYVLVTDISQIKIGSNVIIVASEYNFALSTEQKTNNRGQVAVTKSENIVELNDNVQVLLVEEGTKSGTYALFTGQGYLYAASSSSNHLKIEDKKSDNSSWNITIKDGIATLVSQGENTRNTMQYNQQSSLFACYASDSQKAISLYVLSEGGSEAPETPDVPEHEHDFLNGKCECGEDDPNYQPPHEHIFVEGKCECGQEDPNFQPSGPSEEKPLAIFEFGANGSAVHSDGASATTYTETVNGYTLSITGGSSMFTGANDAIGNSCIKFGTSSKTGSMSFTVGADVAEVVIYVAKYKANTSKINVNGTIYTLKNNSNDGAYDEIVVDTSTTKTITFTTVSGGVRAMVNTIEFHGIKK